MNTKIKLGLLASAMLIFSGCMDYKADYEDKELTQFFIKNNKEKLSKVYEIETIIETTIELREVNEEINTLVSLSFFQSLLDEHSIKSKIPDCKYVMSISSTNVEFSKQDILDHGKEFMYKEAERCLDATLEVLESKRILDLKEKEETQRYKKEVESKLNQKFNPNEVK